MRSVDAVLGKTGPHDHDSHGQDPGRLNRVMRGLAGRTAVVTDLARRPQLSRKQVLTLDEAAFVFGRNARHLRNLELLNDLSDGSAFDPAKLNGHRKGDGERPPWAINVNEVLGFKIEVIVPMPRSSAGGGGGEIEIRGK